MFVVIVAAITCTVEADVQYLDVKSCSYAVAIIGASDYHTLNILQTGRNVKHGLPCTRSDAFHHLHLHSVLALPPKCMEPLKRDFVTSTSTAHFHSFIKPMCFVFSFECSRFV